MSILQFLNDISKKYNKNMFYVVKDQNNIEVMPITRGELVLDSSGKIALHSREFLATDS